MIRQNYHCAQAGAGFPLPTFKAFICGPGYYCHPLTGKCATKESDDGLSDHKCGQDQEAYNEWLHTQAQNNACDKYDWPRKCSPLGRYQRSQSKSSRFTENDSRKFCVDPDGNRIFGDTSADETDVEDNDVQCRCSRKVWELNRQDRPDDIMLHCQSNVI